MNSGAPSAVAAAFGRLCVETLTYGYDVQNLSAAAFGRLCVETIHILEAIDYVRAAAFGRLCVETLINRLIPFEIPCSRLREVVC